MAETIPEVFIRQAIALSSKPLFFIKQQGRYQPISWEQARADVEAFAAWLLLQKVSPSDRVVILSENRPEWAIADIAIQSIGAWTVPIYPSLTAEDVRTICADAQPVICIVGGSGHLAKCLKTRSSLSCIRLLVNFQAAQSTEVGYCNWSDALKKGRDVLPQMRPILEQQRLHLKPNDIATIIYTSGTTGEPKGVMLSHHNFLSNIEACLRVLPITSADRHLSFLPLSHVFERMAGWYLMVTVGASVAYAESPDTVPENILEFHPTIMLGVPRFFEKLYGRIQEHFRQLDPRKRRLVEWALRIGRQSAAGRFKAEPAPVSLVVKRFLAELLVFKTLRARLGGRLRFFVSGSAPLSKEIGEFFYNVGVTILEGYGLTETSPVITVNRLPVPQFGSVGQVLSGVEVKIAEDGEILTRGDHVMQGYYRRSEETAAVVVDGWFHTGDIGHIDPEGFLWITDRKKDLIKTAGGKFVAPQKLENLFISDPAISQAFVYGDQRPYCVALIVPNMIYLKRYAQEQEIPAHSLAELVNHPRIQTFYWSRIQSRQESLPRFEQVKRIALLDREFSQTSGELTPTLKAKRNTIAQHYQTLLHNLYGDGTSP